MVASSRGTAWSSWLAWQREKASSKSWALIMINQYENYPTSRHSEFRVSSLPVCGTEKSVPFLQLGYQGGPHLNQSKDVSLNTFLFKNQCNAAGAPLEDIEPDSSRLRQGWLSPTSDSQAAQRGRCWGRGQTIITAWGNFEFFMPSGCGWGGAS